jgi:hypothetical protein
VKTICWAALRAPVAAAALLGGAGVVTSAAWAQAASEPAAAPVSAAKKELVAKVLKLQQPGVENLGRQLAEQPALQMAIPLREAIARLPQDKRAAVAQQIQADMQRYAEDAVPIVRNRAVALSATTLGPMIEQRFTEDELKQLIAILESPVNARYQALGLEMQRALAAKVVAETQATIEPKFKALEQSIRGRLGAAMTAASGPGPSSGPGAPAASAPGPGPRASGRSGS